LAKNLVTSNINKTKNQNINQIKKNKNKTKKISGDLSLDTCLQGNILKPKLISVFQK